MSNSTVKWAIFFIIILGIIGWNHRPVQYDDTFICRDTGAINATVEPIQGDPSGRSWNFPPHYALKSLASYTVRARILSAKRYRGGDDGNLAPVDLALGWGPMSKREIIKDIRVWQEGRWYYWQTDKFPIQSNDIACYSANLHLIPASPCMKNGLRALRAGQDVELVGDLVEVTGPNNWHWRSSLSRSDSGDGACELMLVRKLSYCKGE